MPDTTRTTTSTEIDPSGDGDRKVPRLALRPKDAARALGIGERKLWELTNRGLVPHVKLGRCVIYPTDALRAWLSKQAAEGARR